MFLPLLTLVFGLINAAFSEPVIPHLNLALTPPGSHLLILGEAPQQGLEGLAEILPMSLNLPSFDQERAAFHVTRDAWLHYFSNKLLQDRIQERLFESITCFLFPQVGTTPLNALVMVSVNEEVATLEASLDELSYLRLFGTSEWDLLQAKEETWHTLVCKEASSAITASAIQSISSRDIDDFLEPLIESLGDQLKLTEDEDDSDGMLPLQIHRCATNDEISPFYDLYISDTDKHYIYDVMHTIAKNNVVKLGLNKKAIRKKGDKFEHVHPLRFLSYVMGEGALREDMRKIRSSSFKWSRFMDGYSKRLHREADQNNLMRYIPGFAHSLGGNVDQIRAIVQRRDWKALVTYFL